MYRRSNVLLTLKFGMHSSPNSYNCMVMQSWGGSMTYLSMSIYKDTYNGYLEIFKPLMGGLVAPQLHRTDSDRSHSDHQSFQ